MKQVPLCFVLMTRRTSEDYEQVLLHIKERYQPAVECGMLDFEPGCWSAIRKVFPGMKLKGCVFHWIQCVWRKVQGVGLAGTYYERKTIYNYVRSLMALPFLPADHMLAAFDKLCLMANTDPLRELVSYIRQTWFESSVYSLNNISIFMMAFRTNNDCEGKLI
ncbi:hypothetical protein SNE40_011423 [Patella caerulea]|uniref:MULE transposase domain-containing protein n=1 Tax=Patella caerulea TaxID=87958 RepID=A0AAN8JN38_PATCE